MMSWPRPYLYTDATAELREAPRYVPAYQTKPLSNSFNYYIQELSITKCMYLISTGIITVAIFIITFMRESHNYVTVPDLFHIRSRWTDCKSDNARPDACFACLYVGRTISS